MADIGADVSVVKEGLLAGVSIRQLAVECPELTIGPVAREGRLPLLFKLVATRESLSIQVHPDDEYACRRSPASAGKVEAWHVLHAESGAWIVLGFNRLTDRVELEDLLTQGQLESVLQRIEVRAGDTYLVQPGIVHAIGPGIVLAEIQQSSDLTYRLYDWGRMGLDGRPRDLHIQDAFGVLRCREGRAGRCEPRKMSADGSSQWERLAECDKFVFERVIAEVDEVLLPPRECFQILYVVEGAGTLRQPSSLFRKRPVVRIGKGDSVLIPVSPEGVILMPEGKVIVLLADASPMLPARK